MLVFVAFDVVVLAVVEFDVVVLAVSFVPPVEVPQAVTVNAVKPNANIPIIFFFMFVLLLNLYLYLCPFTIPILLQVLITDLIGIHLL